MKYPLPIRRRRRLLRALALSAASVLALSACGGDDGGTGEPGASGDNAGGEPIAVTLITKDNTNPYWISMQDGAEKAAKAQNVDLTLAAGAKDGDEDGQVKAIEESISRGDKGIVIAPNGPGVVPAIEKAKDAGITVIALDTPTDPPDAVEVTFATDNFKAGELIGKWAAATLDGKKANIALLDLSNDKVITVDYNRDQGFLTGMGIDVKDKTKNGDEEKTGKYTGGKGGDYQILCNEPTEGSQDQGKTAMERCLATSTDINVVYTINEPAAVGASEALEAANVQGALLVSVDGGCDPGITAVESGKIGATSQQYPIKMAELGVEAVVKMIGGGAKPENTSGLDFVDSGVALVTKAPVEGVESIDPTAAKEICWGG